MIAVPGPVTSQPGVGLRRLAARIGKDRRGQVLYILSRHANGCPVGGLRNSLLADRSVGVPKRALGFGALTFGLGVDGPTRRKFGQERSSIALLPLMAPTPTQSGGPAISGRSTGKPNSFRHPADDVIDSPHREVVTDKTPRGAFQPNIGGYRARVAPTPSAHGNRCRLLHTEGSTMPMTNSAQAQPSASIRTPVQKAALAVGAVFLVVGLAGFIPGITTHLDQLTFAGHHSGAALMGLFQVSVLHNVVHLAFGVAGIALARTFTSARTYLIGGGAIYLVLFLYGLVIDHNSSMNFVPVNNADNWLHLGLAVGMLGLGAALGRNRQHTGAGLVTGGSAPR